MRRASRVPRPPTSADPFAPIEVAVNALLGFVVLLFALVAVLSAATAASGHRGANLFGFGDPVCVDAATGPIGVGDSGDLAYPVTSARGSTTAATYTVCVRDPSFGEQLAGSVDGILSVVLSVGTGLLVRRIIRTARAGGLFSATAARAMRRLGWFLVAMSVTQPVAAHLGAGVVVAAAVPSQHWWTETTYGLFELVSFTLLFTGLGVLTFARILRLAVPLQAEADLTV